MLGKPIEIKFTESQERMNKQMERQPSAPRENKMGVQPVGKLLAGMAIPMMI